MRRRCRSTPWKTDITVVKVLIIALAVALLLWLLFGRAPRSSGKPPRSATRGGAEDMVSCAHCGVHLPRSEALAARSLHYCSAAHRDALGDKTPRS
jgi:uncharacterized protein